MTHGSTYLNQWGLDNPKMVGASEYHAIYELLEDALTGADEEVDDEPADFAVAILDEVIGYANDLKGQIQNASGKQEELKTFYAYEIATDGAYDLGAYLNEAERDQRLFCKVYNEEVETYSIGTVQAANWESALDRIRSGNWEYTQKV